MRIFLSLSCFSAKKTTTTKINQKLQCMHDTFGIKLNFGLAHIHITKMVWNTLCYIKRNKKNYLKNFSIKTFPRNPVPPVIKMLRFAYIFRTRSSSMLSKPVLCSLIVYRFVFAPSFTLFNFLYMNTDNGCSCIHYTFDCYDCCFKFLNKTERERDENLVMGNDAIIRNV